MRPCVVKSCVPTTWNRNGKAERVKAYLADSQRRGGVAKSTPGSYWLLSVLTRTAALGEKLAACTDIAAIAATEAWRVHMPSLAVNCGCDEDLTRPVLRTRKIRAVFAFKSKYHIIYIPTFCCQAKVPCLPRFWYFMNMFHIHFESNLQNWSRGSISTSCKWDDGHERVGVSRLCDRAKRNENEDCSELLLKQNTRL